MPRVTSWRRLFLRLGAVLLLLLVLVFTYQAVRTVLALREAKNEVATLKGEVRRNDVAAVKQTLRSIESTSETARRHSDNLLWDGLAGCRARRRRRGRPGDGARPQRGVRAGLRAAVTLLEKTDGATLREPDGRVDLTAVAELETPCDRLAAGSVSPSTTSTGSTPTTCSARCAMSRARCRTSSSPPSLPPRAA